MPNLNLTTQLGDPLLYTVEEYYKHRRHPLNEDGAILFDGRQVGSTAMCRHCNAHFLVERGSGKKRGWCRYCGGPTCGKAQCDPCRPLGKWLDDVERKASYEARYQQG